MQFVNSDVEREILPHSVSVVTTEGSEISFS
jgi:hypothetical protein